MSRTYYCMNCDYSSVDVTKVLLMEDGETEYCESCYKVLHGK
jgi:hypothetical protein